MGLQCLWNYGLSAFPRVILIIIQHGRNPEVFCIHDRVVLSLVFSAYSPGQRTRSGTFCFAFDTVKTGIGLFGWLEGQVKPRFKKDEHEDEW
jgi:hypothetical protein